MQCFPVLYHMRNLFRCLRLRYISLQILLDVTSSGRNGQSVSLRESEIISDAQSEHAMISAQQRRNHATIDRQHHCVLRVELSKKNEVLMRRGPNI